MGRGILCTLVRKSGFVFAIIAAMAILLVGCETGELKPSKARSTGSGGLSGSSPSNGTLRQFSSVAAISFMGSSGDEASSDVRAQDIGFSQYRQLIRGASGLPLNYSAVEEFQGLPVFYTPPADIGQSNLGAVWDRVGRVEGVAALNAVIEYTWTLPPEPSGKPILLFFNQDYLNAVLGHSTAAASDYVAVEGDTVVLRLEREDNLKWRARINGELLPESATDKIQATHIGQPTFFSRRHGVHTVKTEVFSDSDSFMLFGAEGNSKTVSYVQKGLVFTDPLPEINPNEPLQPVVIENHIAWSDGAPLAEDEVTWSVGTLGTTKNGTGTEISAVWDPRDRTLARTATEEERNDPANFEEVDFYLQARTTVYEEKVSEGYSSLTYILREPFKVLGAVDLKIIGAKVAEPEEPFSDENSQYATVTAEIITFNEDVWAGDVKWAVHILDSEGAQVIEDIATGMGDQIEATWDGTVDGVFVPEPTTYQFRLEARLCNDGDGAASRGIRAQEIDCGAVLAQVEVPIARGELKVYKQGESGLPLGDSEDSSVAPSDIAFSRLSKVHPVSELTLEVNDLQFEGSIPDSLKVQLSGLTSGKKGEAILAGQGEGNYRGDFSLESSFTLPAGVSPPKAAYTMFEPRGVAAARNLIESAIEAIQVPGLAEHPAFLSWPVKRFGRFVPLQSGQPIPDDAALASGENLNSQGFDTIELTVSSADNPGLMKPLRVVVKVPYPVSLFYSIADGDDNSLLDVWLNSTTQEKFGPERLKDEDTVDLKTWILASCRVLDLYDLNNNKVTAEVPLAQRPAPGRQWWLKLGKPGQTGSSKLLLGYNTPVYALYVVTAMNEYGSELERLSLESSVPRDKLEIYAWLSANRKAGERIAACYSACAWDATSYYYISISHPIQDKETTEIAKMREDRGFFEVPLDQNGENLSLVPSSESFPAGTKKFSIPGWAEQD